MMAALISLAVATVCFGTAAAFWFWCSRQFLRQRNSLQVQNDLHLQTIFSLQQQLQQMPRCTHCGIKRVPWASTLICDTCKAARPHEQH